MRKILFILLIVFAMLLPSCTTGPPVKDAKEVAIDPMVIAAELVATGQDIAYNYEDAYVAYEAAKADPIAREVLIVRLEYCKTIIDQAYLSGQLTEQEAYYQWNQVEYFLEMFKELRKLE